MNEGNTATPSLWAVLDSDIDGRLRLVAAPPYPEMLRVADDGAQFALSYATGEVIVYASEDGGEVCALRDELSADALAFGASQVAIARGTEIGLHARDSGEQRGTLSLGDVVSALALSPDGSHVAALTSAGVVAVIATESAEVVRVIGGALAAQSTTVAPRLEEAVSLFRDRQDIWAEHGAAEAEVDYMLADLVDEAWSSGQAPSTPQSWPLFEEAEPQVAQELDRALAVLVELILGVTEDERQPVAEVLASLIPGVGLGAGHQAALGAAADVGWHGQELVILYRDAIQRWTLEGSAPAMEANLGSYVERLRIAGGRALLISAFGDGAHLVVDLERGAILHEIEGAGVDGRLVGDEVWVAHERGIGHWSAADEAARELEIPWRQHVDYALLPDTRALSVTVSGDVMVWEPERAAAAAAHALLPADAHLVAWTKEHDGQGILTAHHHYLLQEHDVSSESILLKWSSALSPPHRMGGLTGEVREMRWCSDGHIAAVVDDGPARQVVLRLDASGRPLSRHDEGALVALLPDGLAALAVSPEGGTVSAIHLEVNGQRRDLGTLREAEIESIVVAARGALLLAESYVGDSDEQQPLLWDIEAAWELDLELPPGSVLVDRFGKELLVRPLIVDERRPLVWYDLETAEQLSSSTFADVADALLLGEGRALLLGYDGRLAQWTPERGVTILMSQTTPDPRSSDIEVLHLCSNSTTVIVVGPEGRRGQHVHVLDAASLEPRSSFYPRIGPITHAALVDDARLLLASRQGEVQIYTL